MAVQTAQNCSAQSTIPRKIIGVSNAHKFLATQGVSVTRQGFYHAHLDKLAEAGVAQEVNPRFWEFDGKRLCSWSQYVLEVQRRKAAGELANNYSLNVIDWHLFQRSAW